MFKYKIIRSVLKILTFWLPIEFLADEEKILIIPSLPKESDLKEELVKAYQQVFAEPPWKENWSEEKIIQKIERELSGNSFLVILKGDKNSVAGFCWGKILRIKELEDHIEPALEVRPIGLERCLMRKNKKDERILYFYEFAILPKYRKGLRSVMFLFRPALQFGWAQGVRQTLFWTTPESKIFPLALYMGYEPIYRLRIKEKDIVFLYHPNFTPLLKIVERIEVRKVARWMRILSRLKFLT